MKLDARAEPTQPVVAHLVSPYLFLTGSWIHSQLIHNHEFRPIVLTQDEENRDLFPFDPVFCFAAARRGVAAPRHLISKYLFGSYPLAPYRRVIEQHQAAVVHAHLGWEGARTVGLRNLTRRPFVCSFYGRDATLLARHPYWKLLYRELWKQGDLFIAEGPHMGETLATIGVPREKIRVVHLGIPLDSYEFVKRRPPEDERDPIYGLIAASFREKKGIPYALDAFARVAEAHPRARLRIIGDGPMRAEIEARIARPDLAGRVDLLGYQPHDVYRRELAGAHFLMAPSVVASDGDSEGGAPVCLLEAQASGLPIVASTHCDIPDVTVPGKSAFLAPERDVAKLADCLDDLLSHPEVWPLMGEAGRQHMENEFDITKQVAKMNDIYRELLLRNP